MKTHFECHNFLVSSLCQLGSNIVPHNINKDTEYTFTHQLNYIFRKERRKKVVSRGQAGKREKRRERE